ncbi:MAG: hypothetical protein Q8O61_00205 [Nocardioides sp.]|nr:hypothetical protein [Nocardioides sp.]
MALSTCFDGDPESCWRVARRLDGLAESLEVTSRFLAHQAALPADDFEGLSGTAYRDSAGRLHGEAVAGASAQRALAAALDDFGTSLDDVRRVLRRARALAREHLVINAQEISPPGPYADERQREIFEMVEGAVREARRVEDQAHHDWQAALAQHAGTATPSPIAAGPFGLPMPGPTPGPLTDPLPDPLTDPQPDPLPDPPPDDHPEPGPTPAPAPSVNPAPALAPAALGGRDHDWDDDGHNDRDADWASPAAATDWAPAPPPPPALVPWELTDGPR